MIRQLEADDWQLLRDVRLRALTSDPDAFLTTHAEAAQSTEELWRTRAAVRVDGAAFVLDHDGRGEGLVSCFVADDPSTVFLVGMWVAPAWRGTGVARGLVERVVDWARAHGAERVCLSVEPHNVRAARLYEKCRFVETSDPPKLPYEPNPGNRFYVLEL